MKNLTERLKSDIWVDSIPAYKAQKSDFKLEQTNDENSNYWELYNSANALFELYNTKDTTNIQPINQKKAHTILNILNKWVEDNIEILTYPLVKDSFENAVIKTIEKDDISSFSVLCGAYTEHMMPIVQNYKFNLTDNKSLKIKSWINDLIKPKNEKILQQNIQSRHKLKEESATITEVAKYYITNPMKTFIKLVNEECISKYKEDDALNVKTTDLFLQKHLKDIYFTKENDINDWVVTVFLPSLLYINKVDKFINSFPDWRKSNINMRLFEKYKIDSKEILDNTFFWAFIKNFNKKYPEYENSLIEKLIPNVFTIERRTIQEKFKFGKKILKGWCDNNESLFKQRIKIWENLGGNMFEKNYENECLASWIRKEKNEKWNNVMDEMYPNKKKSTYYTQQLVNSNDTTNVQKNDFIESMENISTNNYIYKKGYNKK